MTPEILTFEAFGPYVKKQEIDFSVFKKAGLFLIYGKTGAGKTTVLDAMTYALFGESSGGMRGDFSAMRSDFAPEEQNTSVSFTFSVHDKRYKFTRGLRVRTKRNGEKELQALQNAFFMDEKGEFVPFFENPGVKNVRQKAEEILGLTYEQFRQVILLPQGKFEELLVADSTAKEEILVTLFKAEKWQQWTDWLCDRAGDLKRDKEGSEQKIRSILEQHGCNAAEDLKALLSATEEQEKKLAESRKAFDSELEKARAGLQNAQAVRTLFDERERAVARSKELSGQREAIQELEQRLMRCAQAEEIMPLRTQAARIKVQQQEWETKQAETGQEIRRLEKHLHESVQALDTIARSIEEEQETLLRKTKELNDTRRMKEEEHAAAVKAYMQDAAFALSEGLEEGQPCPVCGSAHHPQMAQYAGHKVTIEQVNALEREEKRIEKQIAACEKERLLLGHMREECETGLAKYRTENIEKAGRTAVDKSSLQEWIRRADGVFQAMQAAKTAYGFTKKEAEKQSAAFAEAMETFKTACLERGFYTDEQFRAGYMDEGEKEAARLKIQDFSVQTKITEQTLETLSAKLKGSEPPDTGNLQKEVKAKETQRQEIETRWAGVKAKSDLLRESLARMADEQKKLAKKTEDYLELDIFAKLLRGDKGVGLKRYVLGVMLSAITQQANILLKKVHDGRYQLYRSSEGQGRARKVGLDLEVFDAFSGEKRSVKSLSGGEKFLVALALSLGLSAVVQAQSGGIRIDAMFVDEGFGSLDPSSIENALDILASIRGGQRLVGIISHVQLLKENIEASIEVRKERAGSEIVVNI